mmetsp:Transcript_8423/g.14721  ORF Transcript_8423/g.14721 Transcript_8423/m.14721 type:complete len:159 (+) Transcript_8423:60-536(+)
MIGVDLEEASCRPHAGDWLLEPPWLRAFTGDWVPELPWLRPAQDDWLVQLSSARSRWGERLPELSLGKYSRGVTFSDVASGVGREGGARGSTVVGGSAGVGGVQLEEGASSCGGGEGLWCGLPKFPVRIETFTRPVVREKPLPIDQRMGRGGGSDDDS